jgi:hypothetical protein
MSASRETVFHSGVLRTEYGFHDRQADVTRTRCLQTETRGVAAEVGTNSTCSPQGLPLLQRSACGEAEFNRYANVPVIRPPQKMRPGGFHPFGDTGLPSPTGQPPPRKQAGCSLISLSLAPGSLRVGRCCW